jgi:hypothetical protein
MDDYRRSELSGMAPRNRATARKDRERGAQVFVDAAYGLQQRAGWTLSRAGARPINLERRARFARFDGV